MTLAEYLQYDHEVLRGKLALLEELLPSSHAMPYTIARLTDTIVACLRRHIEEEEDLMALRRPAEAPALRAVHRELLARAEILLELLDPCKAALFEPQTAVQAGYLIQDLRVHLAEEEIRTRPLFEEGAGPSGGGRDEDLVVNEIGAA